MEMDSISRQNYDGKTRLPWERQNNKNKKKEMDVIYLIYRHKVNVEETQWGCGRLDYQNVEVSLDRVKLGTREEGLMKK